MAISVHDSAGGNDHHQWSSDQLQQELWYAIIIYIMFTARTPPTKSQVFWGCTIKLYELLCALHQWVGERGEQPPESRMSWLYHQCQPPGHQNPSSRDDHTYRFLRFFGKFQNYTTSSSHNHISLVLVFYCETSAATLCERLQEMWRPQKVPFRSLILLKTIISYPVPMKSTVMMIFFTQA